MSAIAGFYHVLLNVFHCTALLSFTTHGPKALSSSLCPPHQRPLSTEYQWKKAVTSYKITLILLVTTFFMILVNQNSNNHPKNL